MEKMNSTQIIERFINDLKFKRDKLIAKPLNAYVPISPNLKGITDFFQHILKSEKYDFSFPFTDKVLEIIINDVVANKTLIIEELEKYEFNDEVRISNNMNRTMFSELFQVFEDLHHSFQNS